MLCVAVASCGHNSCACSTPATPVSTEAELHSQAFSCRVVHIQSGATIALTATLILNRTVEIRASDAGIATLSGNGIARSTVDPRSIKSHSSVYTEVADRMIHVTAAPNTTVTFTNLRLTQCVNGAIVADVSSGARLVL